MKVRCLLTFQKAKTILVWVKLLPDSNAKIFLKHFTPTESLGPVSVLAFLRAHLRKAEPCKLLKMLVIGPPRQGKTALLEALQTGRASPFTPTESSISTSTWELDKPNGGKNNVSRSLSFIFHFYPSTDLALIVTHRRTLWCSTCGTLVVKPACLQ